TTVFDGTLAGDDVSGTFTEGETTGAFHLVRAAPPAPISKREVSFANGDVKLAGEMVLPEGPGRHPTIVFLHGSGGEGRWASRYLARKFAQQGFVALVYDKRGVGQSTGEWKQAGLEELAADAVAGVRFLQTQPEVDPTSIGVYGHSQGGTLAPLVAVGEPTLAFIIASAASGLDPAETEIYSVENSIGLPELTDVERADAQRFVREIVEVAYHGRDRADLDAMAKEFGDRAWYFKPPPPDDSYWSISRKIAAFRPLDQWRQVRVPVLLVFGSHDERVPPVRSADAIVAALKSASNTKVTLKMFPNAAHTLKIVPQIPPNGWSKSVPDYAGTLVNWARAQD
ncbi:MAG: alpha/beta fold hydrolase, partial [Alphaproteobacteria bacterium]|nr:alpha/beta fold hydrolase [Alphaproteobacteria bacterium]